MWFLPTLRVNTPNRAIHRLFNGILGVGDWLCNKPGAHFISARRSTSTIIKDEDQTQKVLIWLARVAQFTLQIPQLSLKPLRWDLTEGHINSDVTTRVSRVNGCIFPE